MLLAILVMLAVSVSLFFWGKVLILATGFLVIVLLSYHQLLMVNMSCILRRNTQKQLMMWVLAKLVLR
ncbi:hypothetical protein RG73_24630 (plasmid) [Escherichia coli]|nr:hypothetical protein RG73_24630 [Escherichia coli]